mmetsp:Transcript_14019/g.25985  ORF Transcript_14019/g.25985 Transcript_14019/m.25985 type:complete len:268 (+) Transcript_14019:310-1113(+)
MTFFAKLGHYVRQLFFLLNSVVFMAALGITAVGIYYLVKNNENGVFGRFSEYATFTPIVTGLLIWVVSGVGCCIGFQERRKTLFVYSLIVFVAGTGSLAAGLAQLQAISFMNEISEAEDLSLVAAGFFSLRHFLVDFNLGVFNKCCLETNITQFQLCPEGAPSCFHSEEDFQVGFISDEVVCNRVVVGLKFCPAQSNSTKVQEYNENVATFVTDSFQIAAFVLVGLGSLLLLTSLFGFATVHYNKDLDEERLKRFSVESRRHLAAAH